MAWYDTLLGIERKAPQEEDLEKLNPIQQYFGGSSQTSREYTQSYEQYYETLEIVNRAVNMVVDDCAEIPSTVLPSTTPGVIKGLKRAKIQRLINEEPNFFQDINSFKRNLLTDYILDGNVFIYYDGTNRNLLFFSGFNSFIYC